MQAMMQTLLGGLNKTDHTIQEFLKAEGFERQKKMNKLRAVGKESLAVRETKTNTFS